MHFAIYPDSGYEAQTHSVCTWPFSTRWEGTGDEATITTTLMSSVCGCLHFTGIFNFGPSSWGQRSLPFN